MSPLWGLISGEPNALPQFLSFAVAIVIGITVHEFAHAKAAQKAGDPTPGQHGRVTLNPLAHFDPIGTVALLFAGFGWGRPVPVNPFLMRRPRTDNVLVSLWGPLSNFIVAIVFAIPLRFRFAGDYGIVLGWIVAMNLILGMFNLLPIYPLDGLRPAAAGECAEVRPVRPSVRPAAAAVAVRDARLQSALPRR